MSTHTTVEPLVRDHFDREWSQLLENASDLDALLLRQLGSIDSLAGCLLDLLAEFHNRPASDLGPVVRRLLAERDFVDENGDSVVDQKRMDYLDRQVDLLLEVLEKVRTRCLGEGQWSDLPVTPQMFG